MNLPKVKFADIPLSKEVDWIHGFLFQNKWGWGKYIIRKYPKIKIVYSFKTESEQVNFLKRFASNYKKENKQAIEKNKIRYQREWRKIEREYFETIAKIIRADWPSNKSIKAVVSINPICPRFLNNWSFSLFYNCKKPIHAMHIIMHETCHFLYFKKWGELYPKISKKKYEYPYVEWHLSELVAPIILNDHRVQKILKGKTEFYPEHKRIKINGKSAPKYFTDLYNKFSKENDFEGFVRESYKEINKHKKLFKF